jgi:hypothetical protein
VRAGDAREAEAFRDRLQDMTWGEHFKERLSTLWRGALTTILLF